MILTPQGGASKTGIGLSLLGGAVEVTLKYVLPPRANTSCSSHAIMNNTDTTNVPRAKLAATAANHSVDAAWCQALCCADPTCVSWTFTDPQPVTNGASWDCWFKGTGSVPFPSACGDGHCWSGIGNGEPSGSWMADMGGKGGHGGVALGAVRPSAGAAPPLEIFVDGSIVELYFGGEVLTQNIGSATSQNVSVSALESAAAAIPPALAAPAVMRIDAWEMQPSVVGGPE